jgi:hypothetical protein
MTELPPVGRREQRPKTLAAIFLLGAFVVGGTLGVAADRTVGDRFLPRAEAATVPQRNAIDDFSVEIGLTAGQRAAVDSIMDERHRIIDSIMAPVRPQITAAREHARRQIRQRLDAEQGRRFDAYIARTRQSGKD